MTGIIAFIGFMLFFNAGCYNRITCQSKCLQLVLCRGDTIVVALGTHSTIFAFKKGVYQNEGCQYLVDHWNQTLKKAKYYETGSGSIDLRKYTFTSSDTAIAHVVSVECRDNGREGWILLKPHMNGKVIIEVHDEDTLYTIPITIENGVYTGGGCNWVQVR